MQKLLRLLVTMAFFMAPWVTMGQNAQVSEYDYSVNTASYSAIAGTANANAWTAANQTAGYVDIEMPFAMYFGENQIASGSTLRVYGNGSAEFTSLTGSRLAPLYYASGYTTTATSVYTKSTTSVLTVEWRKVTTSGNSYSFQMKLYPGGDIEFCYGPMTISGSVSVFTGLMSSSTDVFRACGENGGADWNTLDRATDYATRTISSSYYPAYNATTNVGVVYTFTQPACVKPNTLTATSIDGGANLSWNSRATSFQIKYSTDPDFNPASEGTQVTSTTTTKTLTGLTNFTTYYWCVRAVCSGTPSAWSEKSSFLTGTVVNMGDVTTLTTCNAMILDDGGANGDYSVNANQTLTITPATTGKRIRLVGSYNTETNYDHLYVYDGADASTAPLLEDLTGSGDIDIVGDNGPLTLVFTSDGSVVASGFALVATCADFPTCPAPSGIDITVEGVVTWTAGTNNTSYDIVYGPAGFDPATSGTPVQNITGTTYTLTGLIGGNSYDVYVRAHCSATNETSEGWVGPASVTLPPCTAPCTYSIDMVDSWGDGWNGASIDLYVDGALRASYTVASGSTAEAEINVCPAEYLEFKWTTGSYDSEASFTLTKYDNTTTNYSGDALTGGAAFLQEYACGVEPTCPNPAIASASGDGVITWTATTNATSYELIWGPAGFNPVTEGTLVQNITGTTYSITGLASMTTYDVYLRAICSATNETTGWSAAASFSTPVMLPYVCDFESGLNGITLANGTLTNAWCFGSATNNGGSNSIYISNNGGTTTDYTKSSSAVVYAYVTLPLTMAADYEVTYDWIANGESNYDYIRVAFVPESVTLTPGTSLPSGLGTTATPSNWIALDGGSKLNLVSSWQSVSRTVTINEPGYYKLVFVWRNDGSGGTNPPAAIDNISVRRLSCSSPSNFAYNEGTITWTAGTATQWQVRLAEAGQTDYTYAIVNAASYTPTGLSENTAYTIGVRSICSAGDTMGWGNYNFRTPCGSTVALPYSEDFTDYSGFASTSSPYYGPSVLPYCWDYYSNGTNTAQTIGSASYYGGVGVATSTSYGSMQANNNYLCMPIQLTGANVTSSTYLNYGVQRGSVKYAVLPQFTQPVNNLLLSFNYKMSVAYSATGAAATLEVGYITNNDIATFQSVWSHNATTTTQTVTDMNLSTLAASAPTGARLAFKFSGVHNGTGTSSYSTVYCGIDNIYIRQIPNCFAPSNVAASDVTNSTAVISWTENTNPAATAWTLKYGPAGFDPDNEGTAVAVTTTPSYEITGLNAYAYYDVYVRAECSSIEHSEWSDVCSFRTACPDGGDVEVLGTTASTNYTLPVNTYYGYSYTQQIVTAEEIGSATTLNSISISYAYTSPNTMESNVDIFIGYTDKNSFSSSTDFVDPASLQLVYSGSLVCNNFGWNEFMFNTPFVYNGTGNIVVAMHEKNSSYSGSAYKFDLMSTDSPMALSYYSDSYNPDPTSSSTLAAYGGSKATDSDRSGMKVAMPCNTSVTCFAPASISTNVAPNNNVTVTWAPRTDLRPIVNNYELKYGPEGFDPDVTGVLVSDLNNVNTYTITATLDYNTAYDVYVRTVCDASNDDYSPWAKSSFNTHPSCWAPVNVTIAGTTQNTVTLSWANNTDAPTQANRLEVAYGLKGFNPDNVTPTETTNNTAFVVNNLKHSTKYEFYVRAVCNATDQSDWSAVVTGTTQCGVWQYADMPLVENFDDYTGNTGTASSSHVMPRCWSWLNGGTSYPGLPSIYLGATNAHSGTNSLRFYRYNSTADSYKDQFAILPEFGFALDTLVVNFSAKMTGTAAKFYIGTMSDPDDSTTFHMIAPVTATNTNYNDYEFILADYNINPSDRYIAFVQRSGGSYYVYLDDLTVKVREKVNTLSTTGGSMNICNEYIMPDTTGGNYAGNINATYVIRPAEAGKVAHIAGSYDLENGYDYLNVYRGAATANNLVGRYTGTGNIDYVTGSNLWADSGYVTLVFTTDAENALSNTGFKLLVSCECPQAATEPVIDNIEANGTYTWTAGNGRTYTKHSTMEAANDLVEEVDYTLTNVAGCDSATRHLNLIVHPTYELTYSHTMCARDEYVFYGNTYTATGTYTVALQSVFGADSVGILNLQVNPAPTVGIYYNGNQETAVDAFCDNFDMALLARSNVSGATFAWDDNSTDANRVVNPHESSTYTVVATDPTTGCTSLPATLTVTTTPVPALTISGTNEICYGQSTTLTVADANNLDAAYRWNTGATTTSITVNPTTTTTYTVTATTNNASACAVTAEYTVTVNPLPVIATPTASVSELCLNESVTLTAAAVDGYTYLWNNGATTAVATAVPTATGAYTVTVTDAKGCQQDFSTAAITVHPSYELSEERSACVGMLPYTWGAMTLNAAGNYDQHFTIAHGCDSLVHLTFAVQDTTVINSTRELCLNTPFTFGTGIYEQSYVATETGVISYVDTTSDECPTRYNLHLTVNMPVATSFAEDVCDTYTWNNVEYTATGAYNQTLATTKGCDSVVTLNLTVRVSTVGVDEQNVCDKLVWIDGNTYTEPNNSAVFTITNQAGCDSVVTLNLTTVRHATEGVDNILYCDDTIYTWLNGRTYSLSETDGNIKYLLPNTTNAAGCDTTVILNLVMNPVRDTLNWVNVDACDEYEIDTISCDGQIGTKFIRQSGDYQLRTHNTATGRDRITRIHLTVTPSVYHTTIATECLPYTWTITGENGDPFEIATITAAAVNGASVYTTSVDLAEAGFVTSTCSKIEVLRLTPKYPTTETIMDTICQNGSWTAPNTSVVYNGSDLNIGENTMTWRDTELNADGCKKTEQVVLTVNPVANVTVNPVYCESAFTYNETTGEYYVVYTNEDNNEDTVHLTIPGDLLEQDYTATRNVTWQLATGCDNNVTINYTVTATQRDTMTAVACYEYIWNENGATYDGSVFDSVVYDNDCRVISYLDLTINDTVREYDTIDVCTSYEYKGETYRETKTFRELVGTAPSGCDSVLYVTYNVHQRALNEQYIVSNKPYTWANGETYNASTDGVYYNVPVAPGQCDSVLLLHFTMSEPVVLCEGQLPYTVTVGNTSFVIPAGANSDESIRAS